MEKNIAIIDCGSSKTPDIQYVLEELNESSKIFKMEDFKQSEVLEYAGIIISGAPILLTEVDYQEYLEKFKFILDIENPVLGICFGHQIIGLLHGAEIEKIPEVRVAHEVELIESSVIFNSLPNPVMMGQDHCEVVSLPKLFKHTATSSRSNIEAFQHKFKPIYGVQFHPEVSGAPGMQLLMNFVRVCQ